MKGLAFAVSLFHRLTAEDPSKSVEAVVSDVESFAARLVVAGKVVEAAFADAELAPAAVDVFKGAPPLIESVRAIVGGASTPTGAESVSVSGATVASTPPAPTPPAPGIGGLPPGK
jgi:hypothetical protein